MMRNTCGRSFWENREGRDMKKSLGILIGLSILLCPPFLFLQEIQDLQEWHLDVPYVPTKPEVVAKMLEMANVGKDDILYDLGCGDGRIVITAAKLYGTRGVGVDINPERIKESRDNAAQASVTRLVKFLEQDLFQTDIHEATVLTLYLLSSVNLRLRPIIFAELRPGTRVVSHDFSMDTWKPDRSEVVTVNGQTHDVYFWLVPANASGTWKWTWADPQRSFPCELDLEQHFQVLSGRLRLDGKEVPLKDLSLSGANLKFSVEREAGGKVRTAVFTGRVTRDTLEGTMEIRGEGKQRPLAWRAQRNPATKTPIDMDAEKIY
jgi:SAM-dependent methyltransferase